MTDLIREIHGASYGAYGANRLHAEPVLGRGIRVGHNAVAMLMQRAESKAAVVAVSVSGTAQCG